MSSFTWATAPVWLKALIAYVGATAVLPHIGPTLSAIAGLLASVALIIIAFGIRRFCKAGALYLREKARGARAERLEARRAGRQRPVIVEPPVTPALPPPTQLAPAWHELPDRVFVARELRVGETTEPRWVEASPPPSLLGRRRNPLRR
jgi:hypothetical protein